MKRIVTAVISVAAFAVAASTGYAHPRLKAAGPAPGSVVSTSPRAIRIQFTEGVELAFSGIEVKNEKGQVQPVGSPALAASDKAQLIVPVNGELAPGKYTVSWHAVGDDTHKQEGSFNFELKK